MGIVLVLGSSIFPLQSEDLEQGAKRLWACLGIAPQPSRLPWTPAGISSVQGRGMEADQLPQLLLSLLNPKTHRQTGAVAKARDHPFRPATSICVTCQGPAQCGQLWPLPGVPRDLGTRYTSSGKSPWATGASHWDFPWTFPSLLFNQMYLFPLHTIALKLRKWLQATCQRAEANLHVSAFADGEM